MNWASNMGLLDGSSVTATTPGVIDLCVKDYGTQSESVLRRTDEKTSDISKLDATRRVLALFLEFSYTPDCPRRSPAQGPRHRQQKLRRCWTRCCVSLLRPNHLRQRP